MIPPDCPPRRLLSREVALLRAIGVLLVGGGLTLATAGTARALVWGLDTCGGQQNCPGTDSAPTSLFKFAEGGSSFSVIGTVRNAADGNILADALAISAATGLVAFEHLGGDSRLISIDSTTAMANPIGSLLTGRDVRGAAFDLSGLLWAIDAARNELLQIDPVTGAVLVSRGLILGGGAHDVSDGTDIAVDANDTLLVTDAQVGYFLDRSTGTLTPAFDHSAINELTPPSFAPPYYVGATYSTNAAASTLFLFEVNGTDDIDTANVGAGFARSTLYSDVENRGIGYNSGRGDLAAIPVASVPEPATLALVWIGVGMLVVRRRRPGRPGEPTRATRPIPRLAPCSLGSRGHEGDREGEPKPQPRRPPTRLDGTETLVGQIYPNDGNHRISALAFSPAGVLYAVDDPNVTRIVTVDTRTGAPTVLGQLGEWDTPQNRIVFNILDMVCTAAAVPEPSLEHGRY